MDFEVMKKKLDAYRRPKGQFRGVKDELLLELLRMWEAHTGPSVEVAKKLGMKGRQLGRLVQQARKLVAMSDTADPAFQALDIQPAAGAVQPMTGIEMTWGGDKLVRFPSVDLLIDFLKKAS